VEAAWPGVGHGPASPSGRPSRLGRQAAVPTVITYSNWRHRCHVFVGNWPEPYLEVDGDGMVIEWNPRAEEIFGWKRSEVVGRPVTEHLMATGLPSGETGPGGPVPSDPTLLFDAGMVRASSVDHRFELRDRTGRPVAVQGRLFATDHGRGGSVGGFVHPTSASVRPLAVDPAPLASGHQADPLTGLDDRSQFVRRLDGAAAQYSGRPGSIGVVLLDLDRFKGINSSLGHDRGDVILATVARRLQHVAGDASLIARSGGDEFLALFESEEGDALARASAFVGRARQALAEPFTVADTEVFLDASVGVALNTFGVNEASVLLANAESAMYRAKDRGGSSVETYGESMRIELFDRMSTEHSLHRALERSELELHYQPVVELSGVTTVGMEALVRWQHPDQGLVAPYRFIPVAEESGLIIPIGAWVLEQACHQLSDWHGGGTEGAWGSMEVNLSARQIDDPRIISTVEGILDRTGLPPEQLTLEITESALMQDAASALAVLRALKELGVRLAIDDFGTGYSSLSYLQHFPLDMLKVDRSFVQELGVSSDGEEIVAAVINLAHALGLKVVAEGVETTGQLEILQTFGCDLAQGYLFSEPRPASEIVASFGLPLSA
jgi:diguanylate cyclase (GGDEF)-like protein